ncbi:MAG: TIGR03619 family F420-dependent LLM class oxidoreductase [Caulobacterales bacterium]
MKFGMTCSYSLKPDPDGRNLVQLGQLMEESGFETFWIGDHMMDPLSLEIEYPYEGGFPAVSWPDSFIACAFVASATKRLKIGTGVTVVPYRPPLLLAREIATIDFLSGGRFKFGAGVGWMPEEFNALGVPFNERGARADDTLKILIELLQDRIPDFDSKFFPMPAGKLNPLPVQKPYPSIIIGGEGAAAAKRIAAYGNGWQSRPELIEEYRKRLAIVKDAMDKAGRAMSELELYVIIDADYLKENLHEVGEYAELGVTEIVVHGRYDTFERAVREVEGLGRKIIA